MPISIARKLQALHVLFFPRLQFQVYRVALTPDQVRRHGLPSTPLKATELRADAWRREMGVEQTEIDALASLRPDLLRRVAEDALRTFYDRTLDLRVSRAERQWRAEAQRRIDDQAGVEHLERIRADAAEKLEAMRDEIARMNAALRIDPDDFELPELVVPQAELPDEEYGLPLLDSRWSFVEQCRRLIDSKAYRDGC